MNGPLSMSESDLEALEERHQLIVGGAKLARSHLTNCSRGDQRTLDAFDDLLKYIGIYEQVVNPEPITQPTAEMAVHTGD